MAGPGNLVIRPIELNGRPCPCGNHGCLEQYASELAILKDYQILKHTKKLPDISELIENYSAGEAEARLVLHRFTDYIAAAVNNILGTLNPQFIVINSNLTAALPEFI